MTSNLNIYLVERTDEWSYDDYSDFVVICATPEEAINTQPGSSRVGQGWDDQYYSGLHGEQKYIGSWVPHSRKDELLTVTLIGNALPDSQPKIISSSFHAG